MLAYEQEYWECYGEWVAGVDEVGRGCLFGDVVAAAVILPRDWVCEEITDSKKLSEKKREALYEHIMEHAVAAEVGSVDAATIDKVNIKQAARIAMKQAVEKLACRPHALLVDAEKVDVDLPQLAIIKGDALSQSIAAASIVAKVTRDRMCLRWDEQFPEYELALHKGYATKKHREALQQYGASPMHRRSFLKGILNEQQQLF